MAGNLQLYTLLYVTVENGLLAEEGNVTVRRTTGSQAVGTVVKGYAGESPGMKMVEISVRNAVPAKGFEFNAGRYMNALVPVEIGVVGPGGKTLKSKGYVHSDSITHALNQESQYDFDFRGTFADFE